MSLDPSLSIHHAYHYPCLITEEPLHQTSTLSSAREEKINAIFSSVPTTRQEIEIFTKEALDELETGITRFLDIPERTFNNTISLWHEIISSANTKRYLLLCACTDAGEPAETINVTIGKAMRHPDVLMAMLEFAEYHNTPDSLSPSQRTYVYQLIRSLHAESLPENLRERIRNLEETLLNQERLLYTYCQTNTPEKTFTGGAISVFNLNVCCFEDRLPLLWGGVLPWEMRIDEIVTEIKTQDPDVICLQEVFDEKAAAAFYEKLQNQYRHFYINIAPRNFGLSQSSLGISSGLFVASKYRIEEPQFIPFGENSPPERSYGFFHATVMNGNKVLSHVVTTHLQPAETKEGRAWREKQMTQILTYMQTNIGKEAPCLLCGDLNTEWNSGEPAELMIRQHFFNSNNQKTTEKSFETRTCCEYSDYWWKADRNIADFSTKPEIIDYALLLQEASNEAFSIETMIVPMSNPEFPEQALSDHQGLLTRIWAK